jgi:hypothetical protein
MAQLAQGRESTQVVGRLLTWHCAKFVLNNMSAAHSPQLPTNSLEVPLTELLIEAPSALQLHLCINLQV